MEALHIEAKLVKYNKKILPNGLRQKREVDSGWLGIQRSSCDNTIRIHIGSKHTLVLSLSETKWLVEALSKHVEKGNSK
jgi:hypothetical protein